MQAAPRLAMRIALLQIATWISASLIAGWLWGVAAKVTFAKDDLQVYLGERLVDRRLLECLRWPRVCAQWPWGCIVDTGTCRFC